MKSIKLRAFIFSGLLLVTVVAVTVSAFNSSPKKTVKSFWKLCLKGDFENARKLVTEIADIKKPVQKEGGGIARAVNLDGTTWDPTASYRETIFKEQIRLENIVSEDSRDYRKGFLVETIDQTEKKNKYIICLGQVDSDNSWKVYSISIADKNTVSDVCYGKSIEDIINNPE